MSACSYNGTMETAHNYEASAIDIVAQEELEREQERERAHENALCLSPPPPSSASPQVESTTEAGDNNDHGFGPILRTRAPTTALDNTAPNHATDASTDAASAAENANSIISLMQSSPPPHSYRHSRAYRHFKNPPQPHMCIRTTTEAGEELFINVLSWTRIVIPQEPSDPIPLYGGMRVPPGSTRSPPIVFAVMANPEVLKDSGRHSKDPEERRAIVELMCDFVEAMNPGVKLVRNAVILKDRDISGELKDVWNAVQAQRDREREEQMLQQRQQQHYHNITTQQMFPKVGGQQQQPQEQQQVFEQQHIENMQQNSAILLTVEQHELPPTAVPMMLHDNAVSNNSNDEDGYNNGGAARSVMTAEQAEQNLNTQTPTETTTAASINRSNNDEQAHANSVENSNSNTLNCNNDDDIISGDQIDAGSGRVVVATAATNNATGGETKIAALSTNLSHNEQNKATPATPTPPTNTPTTNNSNINTTYPSANHQNNNSNKKSTATPATSPTITHTQNIAEATTNTNTTPPSKAATTTITSPPPKKDKLVGFLPNGCIFPRFKHNKNRDKDKEKESKSKDKEKTFMHALKKNKDKKIAPSEHVDKAAATTTTTTTVVTTPTSNDAVIVAAAADTKSNNHHHQQHHHQSLISLENEVQKLDLGNGGSNSDSTMFIKLKVPSSTAIAK